MTRLRRLVGNTARIALLVKGQDDGVPAHLVFERLVQAYAMDSRNDRIAFTASSAFVSLMQSASITVAKNTDMVKILLVDHNTDNKPFFYVNATQRFHLTPYGSKCMNKFPLDGLTDEPISLMPKLKEP